MAPPYKIYNFSILHLSKLLSIETTIAIPQSPDNLSAYTGTEPETGALVAALGRALSEYKF